MWIKANTSYSSPNEIIYFIEGTDSYELAIRCWRKVDENLRVLFVVFAFYNGNIKSTFYQFSLLAASMSMKDGRENRERRAHFLKPFHPNISMV